MPHTKQQVFVGLTSELLDEIEDFQSDNKKLRTRSETIRFLLERGLKASDE